MAVPVVRWNEGVVVLGVIVALILLWILLGVLGFVIKGLLWLAVVAAVLFLATLVFGGTRLRGRRPTR